ncbi:MAG: radical SAM protein [Planctomycetes bacterium]|nr:radical SAM protein [Planctomycetota bacterium]
MLKLRSVAFELTPRCNQRCLYCYNAWREEGAPVGGELSTGQVCGLVDKVLAEAELGHVTLTGGEPFLRADLLDIIGHVNARGLPVAIISNGRLVDDRLAAALAARDVAYVQVTLLGPDAATHDALCGAGSFDGVTRAAARLVAAGVAVGGSFLCTRRNFAAAGATLSLMRRLGMRDQVAFNRFNPSGPAAARVAELLPTRSQVLAALGEADAFTGAHGLRVHCTMPIPHCMADEAEFPNVEFGVCSAATEQAEYAVDPSGNLKLCTLQRRPVGNLFEHGFCELVEGEAAARFRARRPAFCQECPHGPSCRGGCGAAAEWVFGDPNALDPFLAQHVE